MEEVIKIPSDKTEEKLGMYADMLFRICFVMLKNENDAEDAVQNTFLKYSFILKKVKKCCIIYLYF